MKSKKKASVGRGVGRSAAAMAERERLFIEAYIANGGDGAKAARAAGYAPAHAKRRAVDLLRRPAVVKRLSARSEQLARKYELTADLAARSIVQEMQFDPAKLYDENGQLRPITELDEDTRMALSSVEFEEIGGGDKPLVRVRKYKWASRYQAREQLMKHLGMFSEDNKQRTTVNIINLGGRGSQG